MRQEDPFASDNGIVAHPTLVDDVVERTDGLFNRNLQSKNIQDIVEKDGTSIIPVLSGRCAKITST